MITYEQAVKSFKKAYPRRHIMNAADFDNTKYIVHAQERTDEEDNGDPLFYIDKKTGSVTQFGSTLDEVDKMNEAFSKRRIK